MGFCYLLLGSDEGIYAWVISNHALGSLGGDPLRTTEIVELGGASAQVTFVSSEIVPPEFLRTIPMEMLHTQYTVTVSSTMDRMQQKTSYWNHCRTQLQTLQGME